MNNLQPHITVNGLMLIDAPHSALNMLGQEEGAATENQVVVKQIERAGKTYPYVSAQALRYWWRSALASERNWQMSPIDREKKIAFTQAQPWQYPDDDVFGYMRAQAEQIPDIDKATGKPKMDAQGNIITKKGKNITLTRLSPLKCSPLVSVSPQRPTRDFGTMSRHDGDPVPFEKQFYSCVLKGIFSLNLTTLGRFEQSNKTGFQNISDEGINVAEAMGAAIDGNVALLPVEERRKRAADTIAVLPYLVGGANQTLNLTDVTPKFLILTVIKGGNHLFMNIVKDERGNAVINIGALKEVLQAYKDRMLSDVFIGRRAGFLDEQAEALGALAGNHDGLPRVHVMELNEAVKRFVEAMTAVIE
jgi:CRISPR-associated protein Cst2